MSLYSYISFFCFFLFIPTTVFQQIYSASLLWFLKIIFFFSSSEAFCTPNMYFDCFLPAVNGCAVCLFFKGSVHIRDLSCVLYSTPSHFIYQACTPFSASIMCTTKNKFFTFCIKDFHLFFFICSTVSHQLLLSHHKTMVLDGKSWDHWRRIHPEEQINVQRKFHCNPSSYF